MIFIFYIMARVLTPEEFVANVAGFPARQQFIDANLTPEVILPLLQHAIVSKAIREAGGKKAMLQKVIMIIFASTAALERYLKGGQPEIIGADIEPLADAAKKEPSSNVFKTCLTQPDCFCVSVVTWLPPANVYTHTKTGFYLHKLDT